MQVYKKFLNFIIIFSLVLILGSVLFEHQKKSNASIPTKLTPTNSPTPNQCETNFWPNAKLQYKLEQFTPYKSNLLQVEVTAKPNQFEFSYEIDGQNYRDIIICSANEYLGSGFLTLLFKNFSKQDKFPLVGTLGSEFLSKELVFAPKIATLTNNPSEFEAVVFGKSYYQILQQDINKSKEGYVSNFYLSASSGVENSIPSASQIPKNLFISQQLNPNLEIEFVQIHDPKSQKKILSITRVK